VVGRRGAPKLIGRARASSNRAGSDEFRSGATSARAPVAGTDSAKIEPVRIGSNAMFDCLADSSNTSHSATVCETPTVTTPPPGFAQPGNCHRIALAVHDVAGAMAQWKAVFGAGVMFDHVTDEFDGSEMGMVWMGTVPFLALGSTDPDGLVGRWLAQHGPGVQSLAWEVPDMWGAQNYLQQMGIGITGVHVPGRHFFMHPRDTFGLMLELTDDRLPGDPRQGLTPTGGGDGLVPIVGVARVNAVVPDLAPVAELFAQVFGVSPRPVASGGADFDIGDLTLRVVERRDGSLRRGTLASVTLTADLDPAPAALAAAGIGIAEERDGELRLDPADTFGLDLRLEAPSRGSNDQRS
jgi:hypothetical protein